MYEDNEKKIDWYSIIKKVLMVIAVLLLIFLFIMCVTKCSNKKTVNKTVQVSLKEELNIMEKAVLQYITLDTLPKELNAKKTIKLKYLINSNLLKNIKDEMGNECDTNKSYSEITKLENNYAIKTYIVSGKYSDYKISYIGCFDSCADGEICIGTENMTGGVCSEPVAEENNEENTQTNINANTNSSSTSSIQSSSSNTNKNNSNSSSKNETTNNNSSSNSNNTNNSNTNTSVPLKLMYQYKKCEDKCPLNYTYDIYSNVCVSYKTNTYYGTVVPATTKSQTVTKYFTDTAKMKNEGYIPVGGYEAGLGYKGTKTNIVNVPASCADSSYDYDPYTRTCKKTLLETLYASPNYNNCQYTWSYSPNLAGWTKTGYTKYN